MAYISIKGKTAAATLLTNNFIERQHGNEIIFMTAYGPTQEVRCFAQVLFTKEGDLTVENEENGILARHYKAKTSQTCQILPHISNGYSGLFIIPKATSNIIVASTQRDCYDIFTRIMDQQEFAHRNWYPHLFEKSTTKVESAVGGKACYIFDREKIEHFIVGGLEHGSLQMPPPTAMLNLTASQSENQTD